MKLKQSQMNRDLTGFTLIEVIIALTILSIALSSIILSNIELIRNIDYLRNKTVANWVASNLMNQVHIGLINPPRVLAPLSGKQYMMHQNWYWTIHFKPLSMQQYQVNVAVFNDRDKKTRTAELMSLIWRSS